MPEIDPVTYPVVRLGDQEYELKFRLYDIIALAKEGIDLTRKQENVPNPLSSDGMERTLKLLQHAIAHQVTMATDDLAKLIDFSRAMEIERKLAESIKKAVAQIQNDVASMKALIEPTQTVQ